MAATIVHPTFGRCEVVPSLHAIRWSAPASPAVIDSLIGTHSLKQAADVPKHKQSATGGARDPRPSAINQSQTLTWVSGSLAAAARTKIASASGVAWVSQVYRAVNAEPGPQSYFTINPTVLLLTQQAAAAVGDITAIEATAVIDRTRSQLLKGLVVVNLPSANALEVAAKVEAASGGSGGVMLENIPYISPVGCQCSGGKMGEGPDHKGCTASTASIFPNDTFFPQQWGLQRINAPNAWAQTQGDPNLIVAVLDQGVELTHPDLNLWPVSYSTITHTNDGSPVGDHGTACAGIIAARTGNSLGVVGLAGRCKVMAIATDFADTEVAEGLYYAADNGARVVSMSFGVYPSWNVWNFAIIEAALQYCQDKNVVLVAAAGNEDQNVCRFPGTDPRTICVGGSNRADVRKSIGDTSSEAWWGACYGPDVDVVAPCLEIPTTDRLGAAGYTPTDYDMRFNGTSAATPHVAGLAALILSVDPSLSNLDVRRIISQTTDKINAGGYVYTATGGKPFGSWTNEVGYGRINAERALLVACTPECGGSGGLCLPVPDPCCVSPCDPPWRPDSQCMVWYESRFLREPLGRDKPPAEITALASAYIEFRVTYEHRVCLLGKQHGPLLFTVTLLPGEKVTLYHSERYRRVTSEQQRFSVQTTFSQFLSLIHQARLTGTLDALSSKMSSDSASNSGSSGGGINLGFFNLGGGSSSSSSSSTTSQSSLNIGIVSDQFNQSVVQASQVTTAERSLVVSTYEDQDKLDITSRSIENANDCRAVTYFVRQIVELYAVSTVVSDVSYRIVATGVPADWHTAGDLGWLPPAIQAQIRAMLTLLPKVGAVVDKPQPISIPTDGAVYDPELAHCCSCEPEREASIRFSLEKQKAEAMRARAEVQMLEVELQRRRMLLGRGELAPFEPPPAVAPVP